MDSSILFTRNRRRMDKKVLFKKELLSYIFEEYKKGHISSRREIEAKFHLKLDSFFRNINEVYEELGIKYKLSPNQELKSNKADLLLNIVLTNLSKLGLKLVHYRNVTDKGIDILCMDGEDLVGIELKAYKKEEKLKSRDIRQVEKAIAKEGLKRAILITSTDKSDVNLNIPLNISLLRYQDLKKLINVDDYLEDISFIRENSVNFIPAYRETKRRRILDYVLDKYKRENKKPGSQEISLALHLNVRTYFKSLFDIYKKLQIPPPLKNMAGKNSKQPDKECIDLWKKEFKKYILKIVKKENRYPSGVEIGTYFSVNHIWNIVNVSDLYHELGLKSYLEREIRTTFAQEY